MVAWISSLQIPWRHLLQSLLAPYLHHRVAYEGAPVLLGPGRYELRRCSLLRIPYIHTNPDPSILGRNLIYRHAIEEPCRESRLEPEKGSVETRWQETTS